ncbi:TadE/TadG family type IV pilus assembly protein [Jiella avicenniae]|uniref:Pilus assembly protein n=1 Tax=Jiella avicenniae TaxID=2907202 RepID=A0A9X1NVQ4_9HYPH|nr:TadE/TadG family type IV pilus assembly protein [Jiella avicenniae]MCE7026565.1 pilus assembly protein [Jiella avicenniae]
MIIGRLDRLRFAMQRVFDAAANLPRDKRGVAAVEFAIVVPFIAILYMGGSDAAVALAINRKIHNAAGTIGDLVGQVEVATPSQIDSLFDVTASLMQPYDASKVFLRVTQVKIDANGKATVDWTRSHNALVGTTPLVAGQTYDLPTEFANEKGIYVLMTDAYYDYVTLGGFGLVGPIKMGETSYHTPRLGDKVVCSGC